jgi:hypothetical protein
MNISAGLIDKSLFVPKVWAEAHDDDWVFSIPRFDCTEYFVSASDATLRALIACGFGGERPADAVASHYNGRHRGLSALFKHKKRGMECQVDRDSAWKWIAAHRPQLLSLRED